MGLRRAYGRSPFVQSVLTSRHVGLWNTERTHSMQDGAGSRGQPVCCAAHRVGGAQGRRKNQLSLQGPHANIRSLVPRRAAYARPQTHRAAPDGPYDTSALTDELIQGRLKSMAEREDDLRNFPVDGCQPPVHPVPGHRAHQSLGEVRRERALLGGLDDRFMLLSLSTPNSTSSASAGTGQ
jgi:hypothetical protein